MSVLFTSASEQTEQFIKLIAKPGEVIELRKTFPGRRGAVSGYFTDHRQLVRIAGELSGSANLYVTLNPPHPDTFHRSANVIGANTATHDHEIIARRLMLIDCDPERLSDLASTDAELQAGIERAEAIRDYLDSQGWASPILANSGNGGHLLYRIDLPTDDSGLVAAVLNRLAAMFGDDAVKVDTCVSNPARVSRLYGTLNIKGGNTPERPWRLAEIIEAPERLELVSREQLEALAGERPAAPIADSSLAAVGIAPFDLKGFLDRYGIEYQERPDDTRGVVYQLRKCPFAEHSQEYKSGVYLWEGKPVFHCFAGKCDGRNWLDFCEAVKPKEEAKPSKPGRKSKSDPAATIVNLAKDQDELFHSPEGQAYVMTTRRGRSETILIREAAYKQGLRLRYTEATQEVAKREWMNNAIDQLEAIAIGEGQTHKVCLRLGEHNGKVYLDLADDARSIVEVDADGWRIVQDCPIRFRRTASMNPLPMPERGGSLAELRPLVNVSDDDWPLFVAGLVMMLNPHGPYPLMSLIGREGSAKSSLALIVQGLIDPTQAKGNCESDSTEDLMIAAQQRWLIAFDNLDRIDQRLSDALCRLSTGGSYSRRTKYEDVSETLLSAKCPVLLTSINDVVTAADLLDRSLRFELRVVEQRMTEAEFLARFAAVRTRVLGVLLDGVSSALRNLPNVRIENPPRMADFAHWATAAEEGLGLPSASTLNSYRANRAEVAEIILDSDLATSIREVAKDEKPFSGTAKELAERIEWKGQPKALSDALRKIERALGDLGVVVNRPKRTGRGGRKIEISMRLVG